MSSENISIALHNIITRHKHDIATSLPDERSFLTKWKATMSEVLQASSTESLGFLMTPVVNIQKFIQRYSHPHWSLSTPTAELIPAPSPLSLLRELEVVVGVNLTEHIEKQKCINDQYIKTVSELIAAEKEFTRKVARFEEIQHLVGQLQELEPTDVLAGPLATAAKDYLTSVCEKISLRAAYEQLLACYGRFVALKEIVSLHGAEDSGRAPACTICMTREVDHALTPCGHTFCESCAKNQPTACFICRTQIRDKVRLFFS